MVESLLVLFNRDLLGLKSDLSEFDNEDDIWKTQGDIANSSGHLTLHICGNLKHFIGSILGNSGYVRNRKLEFYSNPILLSELNKLVDETQLEVESTLKDLSLTDLDKTYPLEVFGKPMTTEYFLIHLHGHLTYHLGQINYLRRSMKEK